MKRELNLIMALLCFQLKYTVTDKTTALLWSVAGMICIVVAVFGRRS